MTTSLISTVGRTTPPLHRQWFQFSLRRLMMVIALLSIFMAVLGKEANRHWKASGAARDIVALGGSVRWEHEVHETILYEGALTQVTDVWFSQRSFSDEHSIVLRRLPQRFGLHVEGPQFSDASLSRLKGIPNLRYLVLNNTRVTDKGAADLRRASPNLTIMHGYPGEPGYRQIP